jgi:hypothetical protein
MAAGDEWVEANVTVGAIWCPSPPEPCYVTFGTTVGNIAALVSGERMLGVLLSTVAAANHINIRYRESKAIPYAVVRIDLLLNVEVA